MLLYGIYNGLVRRKWNGNNIVLLFNTIGMRYPLYNMNCDDFESLIILICNHILGTSTIPFAKGKDGGKDGRFEGTANCIPSETNPWKGKIIIQAKHTMKIDASCSDPDFNSILKKEVIPSVRHLMANNEIDYYLLFTNRKLTGIQDSKIGDLIYKETDIPALMIAEEKIQQFLQMYPDVVSSAKLNRLLLPFDFDESDLRDVIIALSRNIKQGIAVSESNQFAYPGLEKKNELNQLGKAYFDGVLKESIGDFAKIRAFLSAPINMDIAAQYADLVSELNAKIIIYRDQFYEFEKIIEDCYDYVVRKNSEALKTKKRLVRVLLHYMYSNCDIGKKQ